MATGIVGGDNGGKRKVKEHMLTCVGGDPVGVRRRAGARAAEVPLAVCRRPSRSSTQERFDAPQ